MDFSSMPGWLSELEIEDPAAYQLVMQQLTESFAGSPQATPPARGETTNDPPTSILSFSNPSSSSAGFEQQYHENQEMQMPENLKRTHYQCSAQDHVTMERNRREKLSQKFMELARIIPDLKKKDKISLLEGATDYVKRLEQKCQTLKEQTTKRTSKSATTEIGSCRSGRSDSTELIPKVEASIQGSTILLRIICENKNGVLVIVLSQIEKLGLTIITTNAIPFDDSTLIITLTTQMEDGFCAITLDDLVKDLTLAITLSNSRR